MPLRKWHPKSKLGCLQCKQRRVKCDERRPFCSSCVRIGKDCVYLGDLTGDDTLSQHHVAAEYQVGIALPNKEYSDIAYHNARRKWHHKSRFGCIRCKKKRIKCDENTPTCTHCERADAACVYPTYKAREAVDDVAFFMNSNPVQMYVAKLPGSNDVMAFEYFHLHTLPMFRICLPSVLWTYTIGFSAQTYDTLRHIAIAVGCQQRLLESTVDGNVSDSTLSDQAEVFYGKAIRSLRLTLNSMPTADFPIIALCCVLFVALECIRGTPGNLLLHLRSAVHITNQAGRHFDTGSTDEIRDLAALIQGLCINAWLFCTAPSYTGDYALVMQDIDFLQLCDIGFPSRPTVSTLEVNTVIIRVIYATRKLMHPETRPEDRVTVFEELYRLRATASHLQEILISSELHTAYLGILEAKMIMTQLFLSATLTRRKDYDAERRGFSKVLDLFERWLVELNSARPSQFDHESIHSFSLTSGAIHCIETIIQAKPGKELEARALDLLRICPPREGLWSTEKSLRFHRAREYCRDEEDIVQRPTFAVNSEDKLASREDCVVLAQSMLEQLHIGD